ncbi:MAG TPA: tetratricopeptide repeat protein [Blastocatellia bacterium]|nr:tetratricopeptide repeat protein [Blastocatellia bacterium]HMV87280.1 tetratricopeptide repeat protein [Blastocatellia bacterium]HMY74125.1 tetratricopeptide repeat protein [Blastocatellia bacterium]HMZ21891.1 tetratricopeptide repeat protein [Blastocatellia bacterium]HNG29260.1 tetratricopeptide repeat protein [Blastocatellia bacterium]
MFPKTTVATFTAALLLFVLPAGPAQAQALKAKDSGKEAGIDFYVNRGQARYADGKLRLAIADFDRALVSDPRNVAVLNSRGLAWLALKDYGMAIRDFNQAIKLSPELASAYANRGLARSRQGHNTKAAQDFTKSIELDKSMKAYVEEMKNKGAIPVPSHR